MVVVVVVVCCCQLLPQKELRFFLAKGLSSFLLESFSTMSLSEKKQHHSMLKICDCSDDLTVLVDVLTVEGQDH